MTESEAVFEILHVFHPGLSTGQYAKYWRAASTCALFTQKRLEQNQSPIIERVLNEIEKGLDNEGYDHDSDCRGVVREAKAKYCPAPEPKATPFEQLQGIVRDFIQTQLDVFEGSEFVNTRLKKLLDQLSQIKDGEGC